MTDSFSFSLKYKNQSQAKFKKYDFQPVLNVIYGESRVGKSDLIKIISNIDYISDKFDIKDKSIDKNIHTILQNPDLQIISHSIENEIAFNLECRSNDSIKIQGDLEFIIKNLLFNVDLKRHPVTLSGGEKELLNISTTLSLNPKIILIDDALSFLSDGRKNKVVNQFNNIKDSVILWFTSDIHDLKYSKSKWQMNDNELIKINDTQKLDSTAVELNNGFFSLMISDLNFTYEDNRPIFHNFSHVIDRFRCLGITGDNGTGKSTLASILLKIEKPNKGKIEIKYQNREKYEIGYLDQFPEKLLGVMTINDFINQLTDYEKLEEQYIDKIKTDLNMHNINWNEIRNMTGLELSWTLIRFILICILSNSKYDILILDEPTFGMGHKQKLNLQSYFVRYLDKKHLILISHDKLFLSSLCDSVIKL